MKKIVLILIVVSISLFAYRIDGTNPDGNTFGYCDNGAFFTVSLNGNGRWFASAVNPNNSANSESKSEAIRLACGE